VLPAVACAGLKLGLPEPAAAPLGDSDVLGEVLSPGENEGDPAEVGVDPPVQAESAAEATMVVVPQPMTVNIALSPVPAMVVRTFMEPSSCAPAGGGPRFPVPAPETGIGREYA